jgi:hypothetical protein
MRPLMLALCLALSSLAAAQLGVPGVRLPQLPNLGLPNLTANGLPPADTLGGDLDARTLEQLRVSRIRELLRRHRDVLEADPHGAPIVRGEVLMIAPTEAARAAAIAAGFPVLRELTLPQLQLRIVVLHANANTARALTQLEAMDPVGAYDFNHLYSESALVMQEAAAPPVVASSAVAGTAAPRLGLIDSGVDVTHEVFSALTIERHGCAGAALPAAHGTAVASLLVGRAAALHGAAPGAALYAADVFCNAPSGGSVEAVAEAFAWLLEQRIAVINVSLVGPPNRLLERVVAGAVARGCLVVAAVGNDGPAAAPLYPAAWPGVVGVTAVDGRSHLLTEAERGPQVKFAAPGADLAAARLGGGYALVRGTSFAAPIVAGLLAASLPSQDAEGARDALAALVRSAQHLGAAGIDPGYGYGIVGSELRRQPALAALHRN